jgi:hypothetical protein
MKSGVQHKLLTMQETADLLRIPLGTLRDWRNQGKGPKGTRNGKRVLYLLADVERYIDDTFGGAA